MASYSSAARILHAGFRANLSSRFAPPYSFVCVPQFNFIVADESHMLKSVDAQRTRAIVPLMQQAGEGAWHLRSVFVEVLRCCRLYRSGIAVAYSIYDSAVSTRCPLL